MSTILEVSHDERVLRLNLNRPEKRNALSSALCHELVNAVHEAEVDRRVGAILITASGTAFCSGMDLAEIAESKVREETAIHEVMFTIGTRLTKPVIAAVQGPALGGGTGLVANAHIVLASPEATFGLTEIRLGLWPFIIWQSMVLAVGERRALELAVTGRVFGAEDAARWGLVHHLVAAESLIETAIEMARGVAGASVTALRSGLEFAYESRNKSWREAGRFAMDFRKEIFQSADFVEGLAAFQQRRSPRWPSLRI